MLSKFYKIELPLAYIVSIFEVHSNLIHKVTDSGEIVLFEVYGLDNILSIENALSKHVDGLKHNLVTNKTSNVKPLVFSASFYPNTIANMWELRVYQKNSRGCVFNRFSTINSLPKNLYDIIKPFESDILYNKKLNDLKLSQDKKFLDLEKEIFLLSITDLEQLKLTGDSINFTISNFTRKQLIFTYDYYNSIFDNHVDMIDDGETFNRVKNSNNKIEPIINLCKVIASKHFIIELNKQQKEEN